MNRPRNPSGIGPSTRTTEAARWLIAYRLSDVREHEPFVWPGIDPEPPVKEMRLACRRLRAALVLFDRRGLFAVSVREVERLQDALGRVRERKLQIERLSRLAASAEGAAATVLAAILEKERARVERDEARLRRALQRWAWKGVMRLQYALAGLSLRGRLGGQRVWRRLGRARRAVDDGVVRCRVSTNPRTAHRLRIEVGKLRYQAELLEPAWPEDITRLIEPLKTLQEGLGALHDLDVTIGKLELFAAEVDDAELRAAALELVERHLLERAEQAAALRERLSGWAAAPG